jgi:quinone-modifying oxidoreductase subunit QmoC
MVSTAAPAGETAQLIRPDQKFIRDVIRRGGESAKKCFQCGTCSVTCELTYAREGAGFPRKLMLWTQWGLKDKVLRDPGIWLCHQCNDCSANCPRGAKPGDVLAAARSLAVEHFSAPSFISRLFSDPRGLPIVFGLTTAILLALVAILQGFDYPEGKIEYARFISHTAIYIAAPLLVAYAVLVAGVGLLRYWRGLQMGLREALVTVPSAAAPEPEAGGAEPAAPTEPPDGPGAMAASAGGMSLTPSLTSTGTDIALHSSFRQCKTDKPRLWGHLAVFYGTPFLLLATALAAIYSFTGAEVQRPASDPAKILGNLGAILLFAGLVIFAYNRLRTKKGSWGLGSYVDWFLLGMVFLLVVTGALLEVARYADAASLAYSLYLVHLIVVFTAFAYAPHGKFAHVFYRAAAMAFAKSRGLLGDTQR